MKIILILLVSVSVNGNVETPDVSSDDTLRGNSINRPGGKKQVQWGGPEEQGWSPQLESSTKPKPELTCADIIPTNAKSYAQTPAVRNKVTYESIYSCDSDSIIRKISFSGGSNSLTETTCTGVFVQTSSGEVRHNITYVDKHGNNRKETAFLTNYTMISSFNNGNYDFVECGIVKAGHCAGDLWTGSGINQVNDPLGCASPGGITGSSALVRRIEVIGKCASRCGLGSSKATFAYPINNNGYAVSNRQAITEGDTSSVENDKKETESI